MHHFQVVPGPLQNHGIADLQIEWVFEHFCTRITAQSYQTLNPTNIAN